MKQLFLFCQTLKLQIFSKNKFLIFYIVLAP
jgi:hypothetical protein